MENFLVVSKTEHQIIKKFWGLYTQECQNSPDQYQMQLESQMDELLNELSTETRIRFLELLNESEDGGETFQVSIALEDTR